MPIYEFYSPDTNRIYSFYAKTLAQGKLTPKCPDDPKARMIKQLSTFAVAGTRKSEKPPPAAGRTAGEGGADDARMEAAMGAMDREFSGLDENDPRAMARMMRRMAELSGEKLDGPLEEAVRKLEEGADPGALEEELGDAFSPEGEGDPDGAAPPATEGDQKDAKTRLKARCRPPMRDPKLHDYD